MSRKYSKMSFIHLESHSFILNDPCEKMIDTVSKIQKSIGYINHEKQKRTQKTQKCTDKKICTEGSETIPGWSCLEFLSAR